MPPSAGPASTAPAERREDPAGAPPPAPTRTDSPPDPAAPFGLLFDKHPLPAYVFDLDSLAVLAVNEAAVHTYGYSRPELLGLTVKDLHPPDDVPGLLAHLAEGPPEGEDSSGAWRHRKKDGTVFRVALAWQDAAPRGRRARLLLARELAERGPGEQELQESERRLRQLAENIRAVFWMTDARATRLLYVSPLYEEVWGRSCEGLYQHPETWQQAIHAEDREGAARVFGRFVRDGNAYQQEYRIVRPDGSVRWVRDRGFPVRDLAGRVYRIAGIAEDVTDARLKEDELRRHARKQEVVAVLGRSALAGADHQALLNGAARLVAEALKVGHVAVWDVSPGGGALRLRAGVGWQDGVVGRQTAGPGAQSQAGYTLLRNEPVVVDDLAAEGRFGGPEVLRAHGVVSGLSVPVGGPAHPFGVLAAHATRPRQFSAEDVHFLQAVANVLAEATARKEALEALRESEQFAQGVLDALAANVAVVGPGGAILAVNAGWDRFARDNGCAGPAACGVGANYLDVCRRAAGAAEAPAVLRGLQAVLDGSLPLFTQEYPCHSPAQPRWFLVRATPCAARQGCAVVAHIDITEQKLAEEALHEADRHKDEFLAMLAHELRNPLAPIRTALEVLKEPGAAAAAVERVLEVMSRQVQHMARLIEDLLDVSRVNRGRIELRKEVVDVAALAAQTAEAVRPLFAESGQGLSVELPPGPLPVEGDPTRLEQILMNLLGNAAKYTDRGGRVWLTAGREGPDVVLRVRDTGIGIAAEMLPRIFDPFVQAERRLDRSQGGIGLGLTLVRRLAELHGGCVEAASSGPGRGSEFTVRLPARAGVGAGERAAAGAGRALATPGRRILIVDDNVDAAESLALLLVLKGHDARAVYDGPSAVGLAAAFCPQLVLLDLGMPGMDGYEVARRLRQQPGLEGAVLVALTGWGQQEDRRRSRQAGFDHHLVKPVESGKLDELLGTGPDPTGG
jgi:PAS domain S-box-containing protein